MAAIDLIAADCDGYWSLASKTMRTARSITSGENFGDFLIMAPFSIDGASSKCGAVQFRTIIEPAEGVPHDPRQAESSRVPATVRPYH